MTREAKQNENVWPAYPYEPEERTGSNLHSNINLTR